MELVLGGPFGCAASGRPTAGPSTAVGQGARAVRPGRNILCDTYFGFTSQYPKGAGQDYADWMETHYQEVMGKEEEEECDNEVD